MEITNRLTQYSKNNISLHVPGHHNNTIGDLDLPISNDMTEITGLDDYHHPEDIIKKSEQQLSRHKDYSSRYLVNGTTVGILSVLYAYKSHGGKKIAIMRNAHKSIFNGIELNNLSAYILPTLQSEETQQYTAVDLERINTNELKDIGLVVLTYPNYFGETYDIESTIQFFHQYNIEVLVDEAHGAHFDITSNFPKSSLNYHADYVVQSYHKTLPSLTMSSAIHINHSSDLNNSIYKYLSILQSSSPSYLLLSSLEQAHEFYLNYNDEIFFNKRSELIDYLSQHVHIAMTDDPLKMFVTLPTLSGTELQTLFESVDIFTELATDHGVLLVLPLWHEDDAFPFEELLRRIKSISFPKPSSIDIEHFHLIQSDGHYQAPIGDFEWCLIENAQNKVLYESLIPYPPGIPYVLAGETITIDHILRIQSMDTRIHGMIDGKIKILKEGLS